MITNLASRLEPYYYTETILNRPLCLAHYVRNFGGHAENITLGNAQTAFLFTLKEWRWASEGEGEGGRERQTDRIRSKKEMREGQEQTEGERKTKSLLTRAV